MEAGPVGQLQGPEGGSQQERVGVDKVEGLGGQVQGGRVQGGPDPEGQLQGA